MKAVIIAAGKGTRMLPLTVTMSKGMIPVANKPLLEWTMQSLDFCSEIIIVVNESQRDIISRFINEKKVTLVFQDQALGTGHALLQAKDHVKGNFLALYGDDIYGQQDIESLARLNEVALSTFNVENPKLYGVVEEENGFVASLEEKPEQPKSNLVNCGLYMLNDKIFSYLEKIPLSARGEYELTDAIKMMMEGGEKIRSHHVKVWIPLSYPWNILDANKYFLDTYGSQISAKVEIRSGAVIEEPVAIGPGSTIGPNCFLRKYSSVGAGCRVGQAVEIKNSIIMNNSYVSHLSYVGDTIVGRKCNIGAGAIFANLRLDEKDIKMEVNNARVDSGKHKLGAVVGDNVKFGVRVTVMPGKRIWPDLMVPACHTVEEDVKSEIPLSRFQKTKED